MADWIEQLKQRQERDIEVELEREQCLLRRSAIIQERLPLFWQQLKECITVDVNKLLRTYPNEFKYHCEIFSEGGELALSNTFNSLTIRVTCRVRGEFLLIQEYQHGDINSEAREISAHHYTVQLDNNNNLKFVNDKDQRSMFMRPAELSERLCRRACKL